MDVANQNRGASAGADDERIGRYAVLIRDIVERVAKGGKHALTGDPPAVKVTSGSEVEPHPQTNSPQE